MCSSMLLWSRKHAQPFGCSRCRALTRKSLLTVAVAPALIILGNHRCLVSNECDLRENLSVVVRREKMIANVSQ